MKHQLLKQQTFGGDNAASFRMKPLSIPPNLNQETEKRAKNKYIESIAKYRDYISRASDRSIQSLRDIIEFEEVGGNVESCIEAK